MTEKDFDWGSDEKPNEEESYRALLRAVERAKGFSLQFVRCTPIKAKELIEKLEADLPQQKTALLVVDAETENLYEQIVILSEKQTADILFVQGLEDPMLAYEQRQGKDILELSRGKGYGGQGWENVPLILGNLNLSREKLRDQFPITLIFFLPDFALNYFIRRAPDFFDWRSNIFDFKTDEKQILAEYQRLSCIENDFAKYIDLSPAQRITEIKEIISYLNEVHTEDEKVNLWRRKSFIHFFGREFKTMIASFEKILKIKPNDHETLLNQGNILSTLGRKEEAITSYNKALEIKPDSREAWGNRGITLGELGRYEEAITSYDKALEIQSNDHQAWHNRGIVLNKLGRYEEAIINYGRAIEIKSEYHAAWHDRGSVLSLLNRYEEALENYDKSLEISDCVGAWNARGIALSALGRKEEAIASYDKALEINPDYDDAWVNRGIALSALGRKEEAIISYDKALKINPDYHEAWNNRGISLSQLEKYEEAIASYDKALKINPDDHAAWNNRGAALSRLGRKKEEIASYDKALELKPDYHEAWHNRGYALFELGRNEEAIASYDKALEIKPDYEYAWVSRGYALSKLGRCEEAITSYDQALKIKPDYEYAWVNRGNTLGDLGRYEEAITSYDKALEIKPDDDGTWNNRGIALSALGRKEEAIKSHKTALSIRQGLNKTEAVIQSLQALIVIHQSMGNMGESFKLLQDMATCVEQEENIVELYLSLAPNWAKPLLKSSQKGYLQSIIGITAIVVIVIILLPFNLIILLWRKIKNSLKSKIS